MRRKVFTDWKEAHTEAVTLAGEVNLEVGIEKAKEFGRTIFRVFMLPEPRFRAGYELLCEVVRPGDPA